MSALDDLLRESLQKRDPGQQFTRRVLAQAALERGPAGRTRRPFPGGRTARWTALTIAAAVALAAGLEYGRERQVRREGQAAKEQLVLALRLAGGKLRSARERVLGTSALPESRN
jgi:hypothetical protein